MLDTSVVAQLLYHNQVPCMHYDGYFVHNVSRPDYMHYECECLNSVKCVTCTAASKYSIILCYTCSNPLCFCVLNQM